jgi:hypothetical protein
MQNESSFDISRDQARVIAAGLHTLSLVDGADAGGQERALIEEFLRDAGHPDLIGVIGKDTFDPATAYQLLETRFLRRVFLEAAVILVRSDGRVSDGEREALDWLARGFGVDGGADALLANTAAQQF